MVVDHPSNCAIYAAELPSVARINTHWIRWYSEWLCARLSRSANREIVGLSHAIRFFIHDSSKSVDQDYILFIECEMI